ncbi:MAG: FAD-binding oxidoreductase [Gammaproteobacteria bacterium]|nr:FAD-binding oxidoreductase [Gammaproteobacteria bacterium]MXW45585.1 FAD-binding oxidoreductase [Gammaproteobacteria bacterium]MYD02949.1 FAD-binding oxidoreductase [Gammaproteobacteria bacterium]MYI25572.1 FAD-binding oxidoreductase [Gammaproteobacteria bacterium]
MDTVALNQAIAALRKKGHSLVAGDDVGERHSVDFTAENALRPEAVLRPGSVREVAEILKVCNGLGQPVVVQGGMTGLAGGATPQAGELALSLERLTGIEELDEASMTISAQAGTPLQVLQEAAEQAGFLLPLDFGARGSCHIGGAIATNAGGNQVIRFGMTRNLVLGLEAVLADGTVISSMNKMLKNNAGYDLKQLFIGTEGTLGVITRCVLRLLPRLASTCTALCAVDSFPQAAKLLRELQSRLGGSVSAFELMWADYFHRVIDHGDSLRSPFAEGYPMYALIEAEGPDRQADEARFEAALGRALESGVIADAAIARSVSDRQSFWAIRDGVAEITAGLTPYASLDVSMDIGEMAGFVDEFDRELKKALPDAISLVFGHIGDNNLHLLVSTRRHRDLDTIFDIGYRLTGAHRGSVSAEHGIGVLKRGYLHYSRSPEELALMRRLKKALDPKDILNRGRVIPG